MSERQVRPHAPQIPHDERRSEHRLHPDEVPWIREVKPLSGDTARLVDISRTGLQIETTARLAPGRRSALVLVDADERTTRIEGLVVRTQLVAISPKGERIYRCALSFPNAIDVRIPAALREPDDTPDAGISQMGTSQPASDAPATGVQTLALALLEGPFDGVVATADQPCFVAVRRLTEAGCFVSPPLARAPGEQLSLSIIFSPSRSVLLTATVMADDEEYGTQVRFTSLSSDVRRQLRVQIGEGMRAAGRGVGFAAHQSSVGVSPHAFAAVRSAATSANRW